MFSVGLFSKDREDCLACGARYVSEHQPSDPGVFLWVFFGKWEDQPFNFLNFDFFVCCHYLKEDQLAFAQWIDEFCPAKPEKLDCAWLAHKILTTHSHSFSQSSKHEMPLHPMLHGILAILKAFSFSVWLSPARLNYAVEFKGPAYVRPWMLAWRSDASCSGYIEPEQLLMICEIIIHSGCPGQLIPLCILSIPKNIVIPKIQQNTSTNFHHSSRVLYLRSFAS